MTAPSSEAPTEGAAASRGEGQPARGAAREAPESSAGPSRARRGVAIVLDATPLGRYAQIHAAAQAYRGTRAIRDIVGLGAPGANPVSAAAHLGYRPRGSPVLRRRAR